MKGRKNIFEYFFFTQSECVAILPSDKILLGITSWKNFIWVGTNSGILRFDVKVVFIFVMNQITVVFFPQFQKKKSISPSKQLKEDETQTNMLLSVNEEIWAFHGENATIWDAQVPFLFTTYDCYYN